MKQKGVFISLAASFLALVSVVFLFRQVTAVTQLVDASWQAKVDGWVMATAVAAPTEFLVVMAEQADLSAAANYTSKEAKGRYVYETLSQIAARTQAPVIAELEKLGVEYRSYWVNNMIWVRGDTAVIETIARRSDVARIDGNKSYRLAEPIQETNSVRIPSATEWGLNMINAPDVWNLGFDGTGIVIGGQDTGYRYTHDAIDDQYRGSGGSHDYNWHDSIHSGGGICGADSPFPCDDHGHGTHTMGTMVGDDGAGNQIGVAPGAEWIGCRNMNVGAGTPATYSECFQWFIAPTRVDGSDPNPAMAPHVINNSWTCPDSEGCAWDSLQTVVGNTRAAGIIVVVSAGNAGSSCNTVNDPPAIYDDSYSVGSTTSSDTISSFSSRGPADDTGLPKPDISAPGSSVRSASGSSDTGYTTLSGTSMAGPHVAGAIALLLQRAPSLMGDQTAVENTLNANAEPKTTTQTCGGVLGSAIPNNTYGWGRLDILTAVNKATIITANPTTLNTLQATDTQITQTVTISNSGHANLVWNIYEDSATACNAPHDISWLTATPISGTITAGYATLVDVTFDATSLSEGIYNAHLCLASNDLDTPTITLPITMTIRPPLLPPNLSNPVDGAVDVSIMPTLTWNTVSNAGNYLVEVATDNGLANIVVSGTVTTTNYNGFILNDGSTYSWRVTAQGGGETISSGVFSFTTKALDKTYLPLITRH